MNLVSQRLPSAVQTRKHPGPLAVSDQNQRRLSGPPHFWQMRQTSPQ